MLSGKGIHSILDRQLYTDQYHLIGISGGTASPDNTRWAQMRSYIYDVFRKQMQTGELDLDYEDTTLKEQMEAQPYDLNARGAIQIMPKSVMRDKGLKSPDELDAAIFAGVDLSLWTGNHLNDLNTGDQVVVDPYDLLELEYLQGAPM